MDNAGSPPPAAPARAHGSARVRPPSRAPVPPSLVAALQRPAAYAHTVGQIRVVETHISWVLLTGDFAYKVKKPVNLGFLDFSTLAQRQSACEEELRLNRRWTPELYLETVPITATGEGARMGGAGPVVDWAVRMRQFPAGAQLDERLEAGTLAVGELAGFAGSLAHAHAAAPVAPSSGAYGGAGAARRPVDATLAALLDRAQGEAEAGRLARLRAWAAGHPPDAALDGRSRGGFVREVHGDLHLGNLVLLDGRVRAFDCIEFDPALRWIDVMSDVAFLVMDLAYRGRQDLAHAFLSGYLEATGDYAGLAVHRWYGVYRALVRAKIGAIQRAAHPLSSHGSSVRRHLELAEQWTQESRPGLLLMHGFSGSGKTRVSEGLVGSLPALRLRSDLERRRVPVSDGADRYAAAAVEATYARLADLAGCVLEAGENAIVDATFLRRAERERFYALAAQRGVRCTVLGCRAPRAILEHRVAERARDAVDASEADAAVLAHQLATAEPLAVEERARVVEFDTSQELDLRSVTRALNGG
jgi:aminoglycoside phosphotransferase family enzyme/predicted kinase